MAYARRVDRNHKEIIEAFRALGFSVADTSRLGGGFPDCIVAKYLQTAMIEIKDGKAPKRDQQLRKGQGGRKGQIDYYKTWKGIYRVVKSLDDVNEIAAEWNQFYVLR